MRASTQAADRQGMFFPQADFGKGKGFKGFELDPQAPRAELLQQIRRRRYSHESFNFEGPHYFHPPAFNPISPILPPFRPVSNADGNGKTDNNAATSTPNRNRALSISRTNTIIHEEYITYPDGADGDDNAGNKHEILYQQETVSYPLPAHPKDTTPNPPTSTSHPTSAVPHPTSPRASTPPPTSVPHRPPTPPTPTMTNTRDNANASPQTRNSVKLGNIPPPNTNRHSMNLGNSEKRSNVNLNDKRNNRHSVNLTNNTATNTASSTANHRHSLNLTANASNSNSISSSNDNDGNQFETEDDRKKLWVQKLLDANTQKLLELQAKKAQEIGTATSGDPLGIASDFKTLESTLSSIQQLQILRQLELEELVKGLKAAEQDPSQAPAHRAVGVRGRPPVHISKYPSAPPVRLAQASPPPAPPMPATRQTRAMSRSLSFTSSSGSIGEAGAIKKDQSSTNIGLTQNSDSAWGTIKATLFTTNKASPTFIRRHTKKPSNSSSTSSTPTNKYVNMSTPNKGEILMCGALFKKSSLKRWKKRWMVLTKSSLFCFQNETSHKAKQIDLHLSTFKVENNANGMLSFCIITPVFTHYFMTDSIQRLQEWAQMLQSVCTGLMLESIEKTDHPGFGGSSSNLLGASMGGSSSMVGNSVSSNASGPSNTHPSGHVSPPLSPRIEGGRSNSSSPNISSSSLIASHGNLKNSSGVGVGVVAVGSGGEVPMGWQEELAGLLREEWNSVCADCGVRKPEWASISLGVFVCIECSGVHRSLGVSISKVRSVTLDVWEPEWIKRMRNVGNRRANEVWEAKLNPSQKPQGYNCAHQQRADFIRRKYIFGEFKDDTAAMKRSDSLELRSVKDVFVYFDGEKECVGFVEVDTNKHLSDLRRAMVEEGITTPENSPHFKFLFKKAPVMEKQESRKKIRDCILKVDDSWTVMLRKCA